MIILEDTRQQDKKHKEKAKWFAEHGIEVRRCRLYAGDYTLPTDQSVCVDTKRNIQELVGDLCGKDHERFRNELLRAQEAGISLVVLVENEDGITQLSELHKWVNPRLFIRERGGKQKYPNATRGVTLMKICMTMEHKYGVRFMFCSPEYSGAKVVELLGGSDAEKS